MPDARSLSCPHCGAPAEPGTGRCVYCRGRLATVSCPKCFALLFDAARFCPSCGAPRERTEVGDGEIATCPACRGRVLHVRLGTASLLECADCDGVWIDAADFERICADREAQAAVLHRWTGHGTAPAGPVRYRPCLRCKKLMNRVNFGRLSGTVVDVCRGHGTFLDVGELHAIVTFIEAGGLDRARAREMEELREEERKLQALQAQRSADNQAINYSSRAWSRHDLAQLIAMVQRK